MEAAKKQRFFCPGDAVAILLVLALAIGLLWGFFASERGLAAEILVDGERVAVLPLSADQSYFVSAKGYSLTVCVEDGAVFVSHTDCPDRVCEHTGRVSAKGASIVCAAAGVLVRVVGGGETDVDFVAG